MPNISCFRCGDKGHYAGNCPGEQTSAEQEHHMDATEDRQGASGIQEENTSDRGDQNLQIDNGKISNDNATAVHFQWAQIGLNQTEGDSSSPQQH